METKKEYQGFMIKNAVLSVVVKMLNILCLIYSET